MLSMLLHGMHRWAGAVMPSQLSLTDTLHRAPGLCVRAIAWQKARGQLPIAAAAA